MNMGPADVDILIGLLGELPRRMRGPPLRQQDEAPESSEDIGTQARRRILLQDRS